MKRLMSLAIVCALSLTAAACATMPAAPPGSGPPPVTAAQNTLLDERALFAAEATYNVAAQAYLAADGRGQIPAPTKAAARSILIRSYEALRLARQAYQIGEADTFTAQIASAAALAAEARALVAGR